MQLVEVETLHRVLDMKVVEDYAVAIDAGAHVGTWAALMAVHFSQVIAFEPNPPTFEMLFENTAGLGNVEARLEAVMDKAGPVRVFADRPGKTLTGWKVDPDPQGSTRGIAIDDLGLESCGLIKLDLEGAELLALHGARRTIRRCRPVLIVEICGHAARFGHSNRAVAGFILGEGYRELFRAGVDHVYVPE